MKLIKGAFLGVISTSVIIVCYAIWFYESPVRVVFATRNSALREVEAKESGVDDGVSRKGVNEHVLDILSVGLAKIEDDVLQMDIGAIVGAAANVSFHENRLLAKLQGLYKQRLRRCVIRVAIYCSTNEKCVHLQTRHQDVANVYSWQKISCLSSVLPCDVERRLVLTMTPDILRKSDVVFYGMTAGLVPIDKLMALRPPGQLWAFTTWESPLYRGSFVPKTPGAGNPYNLTMYYTHEADLYSPYGYFHEQPVKTIPPLRNKTKLMAWMASHCSGLPWRRLEFVKYLKQYLDIDVYGKCGDLEGVERADTVNVLAEYKFYLALENNECREYITEKVSKNAYASGAVPIVFGSRPRDYARILPANSYIHLQEFQSIGDFVDFIQTLDNDVGKYNKYFGWRKEGVVRQYAIGRLMRMEPEVTICYILRKLVHVSLFPETSWQRRFPDFGAWLREQCPRETTGEVVGFPIHQPSA